MHIPTTAEQCIYLEEGQHQSLSTTFCSVSSTMGLPGCCRLTVRKSLQVTNSKPSWKKTKSNTVSVPQ